VAHRWQLAPVFQNLIGNAITIRGKKPPAISVVQAESSGAQRTFSVRDRGIGIGQEYAENIFVVFRRLHARTEYAGNESVSPFASRPSSNTAGRFGFTRKPAVVAFQVYAALRPSF